MLSPSDFNNAVPQFTNGNYANNPLNPQYIAEPSSTDYNRGVEPLTTLPAQWWNWFLNKFTSRFNKINVYVKNIFNELSQLLSLAEMTPDGTEGTPTIGQLKTMFSCCYPTYVKTELGLGTASTANTGTASGCIPTIGCTMGTTNNNIVVTDATGKLKPSGTVLGTAAGCDASCFRSSTWTPTTVTNACNVYTSITDANSEKDLLLTTYTNEDGYQAMCISGCCPLYFNPRTGRLYSTTFEGVCFYGSFCGPSTYVENYAISSSSCGVICFITSCKNAQSSETTTITCIRGDNGYYYGNICGNVCGLASRANYSTCLYNRQTGASKVSNVLFYTSCTNASCTATNYASCICGANGYYYGNVCGCLCGTASNAVSATKASQDSSGCTFGTAARYACTCFLSATGCACDSAKLTGKTPGTLCVACAGCASCACQIGVISNAWVYSCLSLNCFCFGNLCNYPILALVQAERNSKTLYLSAGGDVIISAYGGFGTICNTRCGIRLF